MTGNHSQNRFALQPNLTDGIKTQGFETLLFMEIKFETTVTKTQD